MHRSTFQSGTAKLLCLLVLSIVCLAVPLPGGGSPALAQGQLPPVSYNPSSNTISIGSNYAPNSQFAGQPSHPNALAPKQPISIPQLDQALAQQYPSAPDPLVDQGGGAWLLKADTIISPTARLDATSDSLSELRLDSSPSRPAAPFLTRLIARGGYLNIDGIKVHSWAGTAVDANHLDGRSYLLALSGGRMDIKHAEVAYLGWADGEPSGMSWRKRATQNDPKTGATGEILDSDIHHNYFGQYSFEAYGLKALRNEFHDNLFYGFDPHDYSQNFEVAYNTVYNNGKHGIIFSRGCTNNFIHHNTVYNNAEHGIMLDRGSDHNLVENNTVYGNSDGVAIFLSIGNTVRSNTLCENNRGVRINATFAPGDEYDGIFIRGGANNTTVTGNTISGNGVHGIYVKSSGNLLNGNMIVDNKAAGIAFLNETTRAAAAADLAMPGMTLSRAQLGADLLGVVVASTVEGNTLRSNTIARNIEDGIEIKAAANTLVEGNTTERNGAHGIYLANGADGNRLIKNTVATNKGNGIRANGADVLRNSWSENRVFDNAAGSIATTSRANANMRQPRITAVAGKRVTGTAAPGAVVELFSDIGRQARYFEGRTTAGADGSFTFVVSGQAPNIAATATDANGNSSAMSGSPSEFIFLPIVRR